MTDRFEDARGHTITAASAAAAAMLDEATTGFARFRASSMRQVRTALAEDPACGFAHVMGAILAHSVRDARRADAVAGFLASAEPLAGTMSWRERRYLDVAKSLAALRPTEAVVACEEILEAGPTDILALRLAQLELFWLGEMDWSEDISARVAPAWSAEVPTYPTFLSCRAFDLEETGRMDEAERLAREAVEREPEEVWGAHALAHVLFMQNRAAEGVDFLARQQRHWEAANNIAHHLYWHQCLFHLERREPEAVLAIYDERVRNLESKMQKALPDFYLDIQNGVSMLLRLEMLGVDVGERWQELAGWSAERLDDPSSPFTSAHYALALAASGRFAEAETLLADARAFAASDGGPLAESFLAAAIPGIAAAIAYRKGDHAAVLDALLPARWSLWRFGGSHAQRELFHLMLLDSARRLGRGDVVGWVRRGVRAVGIADPEARIGYADTPVSIAAEG